MTKDADDRKGDAMIARLLQDAECVIDTHPGSLQRRKNELRDWMAGVDRTDRPEAEDDSVSRQHPPGARLRFINFRPDLALKPLDRAREPDRDLMARLRWPVGDHGRTVPAGSSCGRPSGWQNEAAEAALSAVSELRTRLTLVRPDAQTRLLHRVLAQTEEELSRTGQISVGLYEQLRTVLTDAPLDPALADCAGVVARLLAGE
ncbi:hypothetical protein [Streptomyces sp. NPDC060027]|uniref:hypothetical protein n=1 Tax=Streptomyces sp. NPDC060027 TaxID=3347040 RepID=UPI0036BBB752